MDEELRAAIAETNSQIREFIELSRARAEERQRLSQALEARIEGLRNAATDYGRSLEPPREEATRDTSKRLLEHTVSTMEFQGQVLQMLREQNALLERIATVLADRRRS
jgi:hypothetical protein